MTTTRRWARGVAAALATAVTGGLLVAAPAPAISQQTTSSPPFSGPTARYGSVEDPDVVEPAARDVRSASFRFEAGTGTAVVQLGAQPDAETAATLRVHHGRWNSSTQTCTPEPGHVAVVETQAAQDGRVEVPLTYALPLWNLDCAGVTLVSIDGDGGPDQVHDAVETQLAAENPPYRGSVSIRLRDQSLVVGRGIVRVHLTGDVRAPARSVRVWVRGRGISTPRAATLPFLGRGRAKVVSVPVRVRRGADIRIITATVTARVPQRFTAAELQPVRVWRSLPPR